MGEHFIVVHNPHATNSLPPEVLPFGEEYRAVGDYISKTREPKSYRQPDAFEHLYE